MNVMNSASPEATLSKVNAASLLMLADEWDKTAASAEKFCVGDELFRGEARGLQSAAKELREHLQGCAESPNGCISVDAMAKVLDAPITTSDSTIYQVRTRADYWTDKDRWLNWEECSEESYRDHLRTPFHNEWHYEVRILHLHPTALMHDSKSVAEVGLSDTALAVLAAFSWVIKDMDAVALPADAQDVAQQVNRRLLPLMGDDVDIVGPIFQSVRGLLAKLPDTSAPANPAD